MPEGVTKHLHRDLGPENILVDPATGALTGVIDFEDTMIGDPAFDFCKVVHIEPETLDLYDGPRDPGFELRIEFYRRLEPLHELRYGIESGLPDHVQAGRRGLRTILEAE